MWINVFPFLILIVSGSYIPHDYRISYTVISYTTTGEPCMTDCVQGKCRTGWKSQKPCTPGTTPAPVYYTAHNYEGLNFCRSKCGKYGYNYNWCIVNDNFRWDYCNPNKDIEYISLQMTNSGDECKSKCSTHGSSYDWCRLYTGEWNYCDRTEYSYIRGSTLKGEKCNSFCTTHKEGGSKCYASNVYPESCAPPAIDQGILHSYYNELRTKFNLNSAEKCAVRSVSRSKRFIDPKPGDDLLSMIGVIENQPSPRYETVNVNEVGNSVYRYTLLRLNTVCEPTLPLIVRARITSASIPARGSRATSNAISSAARSNVNSMGMLKNRADGNNDEVGHLIGYQNGGSNQPYNFVPQARSINRGYSNSEVSVGSVWAIMENNINSWVRNNGGTVEQSVFVHYNLPSTRPTGFSVVLENYLADGTRGYRTTYYISNDPSCLRDNADMSISF